MADGGSGSVGGGGGGRLAADPRWLAAGAAGLTAAVMALWAIRGLPGGALLLWATPLPLFLAGIGFGGLALLGAVAVASFMLATIGTNFGLGLFLLAFAGPVTALVLTVRGGATAPDLSLSFALLGLLPAAGVGVAAVLLADRPGGLEGSLRHAVEIALNRLGVAAHEGLVAEVARVKAAAIGFWVAVTLLLNAAAAGALLVRTGVIAVAPAWREARLPAWYVLLPALAFGAWRASDEAVEMAALSVLLALLVPVFLHGLAGLHRLTQGLQGRPMLILGAYAALLVFFVPVALAVTGYGLYDILNGTGARRGAPPRQS